MANIYDIAEIQAGDPLGFEKEKQQEALTHLVKYRNQKRMIDEINKAIKAAEKKAKKSGGWKESLLSTLVGGLAMGATGLIPGVAGASGLLKHLPRAVGALGAGGASYAQEKHRQEKLDATKELKELKGKYSGRGVGDEIQETIDIVDDALKNKLEMTALTDLGMQAILPTNIGKIGSKSMYNITDIIKDVEKGGAGVQGMVSDITRPFKWGIENVLDMDALKSVLPDWAAKGLSRAPGAANMLSGLLAKNLPAAAVKTMGRDELLKLLTAEAELSDFSYPEFKNPYSRGGY